MTISTRPAIGKDEAGRIEATHDGAEGACAPKPCAPEPCAPEQCLTMEEVRAGVDAVDRALVAMLVKRQAYMEAAARIKPDYEHVRVPWRIEQVVQNILSEARKMGLSERIAEPVWRVLIEKSIEHEAKIWQMLRCNK